ncbi:hypothetical protein QBC34DRAFT_460430 [Podospora aff. communis PSN243]|uniref:Uncharacterized protein n=1 Tax=Podospora aff. communis PSN243 TaxID=3040156 RepID=A0AAV9H4U5_9PEZI|nr:hypothetical protein QBC34DRAFT_460430 [Podospora aff. communis PSN243]
MDAEGARCREQGALSTERGAGCRKRRWVKQGMTVWHFVWWDGSSPQAVLAPLLGKGNEAWATGSLPSITWKRLGRSVIVLPWTGTAMRIAAVVMGVGGDGCIGRQPPKRNRWGWPRAKRSGDGGKREKEKVLIDRDLRRRAASPIESLSGCSPASTDGTRTRLRQNLRAWVERFCGLRCAYLLCCDHALESSTTPPEESACFKISSCLAARAPA